MPANIDLTEDDQERWGQVPSIEVLARNPSSHEAIRINVDVDLNSFFGCYAQFGQEAIKKIDWGESRRREAMVEGQTVSWLECEVEIFCGGVMLRGRVERIADAMRTAGISEAGLQPIAATTIARGYLPRFEENSGQNNGQPSASLVWKMFGLEPAERSALAAAFPLEADGLSRGQGRGDRTRLARERKHPDRARTGLAQCHLCA
ncbi:hypothetical protein ROLI_048320 (plasmid) [Roseobacter fucihabitans]|uniref:Uncharacterized protein n=1 Tax=Roseobacter fucihabitans TaxID=1537242 RepID=A0ABZ2C2Z0_9RHOB|nr:hypothetical protein [Roseobacter litoralis]MBC6967264.1 hypothetical protein [Roseobacter litoralis]